MPNSYNDIGETEPTELDGSKNYGTAQSPLSAHQRRRAALEELDEAKFSVSE